MGVKVKICGNTNLDDAQGAVEAGADMLGFIFYEASPRFVTVAKVADITRQLPPHVVKVGVFVNPTDELVFQAIATCGMSLLQFHGDETPEFCTQFGVMSVKAFRIRDAQSLSALMNYPTDAWLLDTFSPDARGGTGTTFNWDLAVEAGKFGKPIILAGGLAPENVADAVRKVRPFGVDVSSGVESSPGKKDLAKVRNFIAAAKQAGEPAGV
jgi:phosphoribosylanthranilate isomerase